jgi:hypothetical protein
LSHY